MTDNRRQKPDDRRRKTVICFLLPVFCLLVLAGCATITGPSVSREEIEKATEELKIKALAFQIKQRQRLNNIGNRVILTVGREDIKTKPHPFLGIAAVKIDKYLKQLYDLNVDSGIVVIVVEEKSPAYTAGLRPGDVIISLNNTKIKDINYFNRVVSRFKIGEIVEMNVLREEESTLFQIEIGQIPINIPLELVDMQEVNAATDGKAIYVTNGLMHFVNSDDELAAVIAHELAHAVRGHVVKMQGTQVLGAIAALVLGSVAESGAPGSGDGVARGVGYFSNVFGAGYSRDLEREADYFSVKFIYKAGFNTLVAATLHERFAIEIPASMIQNYLSTHPSSPERAVRIRKIIEELKTGRLSEDNYNKAKNQQ